MLGEQDLNLWGVLFARWLNLNWSLTTQDAVYFQTIDKGAKYMAIRNIRQEGDEILKKKSREVEVIDDKVRELIEDMVETMHKYEGVGLAAVQVGILKRIIVIDIYD